MLDLQMLGNSFRGEFVLVSTYRNLVPLFDPKVHPFENSLLKIMAQLPGGLRTDIRVCWVLTNQKVIQIIKIVRSSIFKHVLLLFVVESFRCVLCETSLQSKQDLQVLREGRGIYYGHGEKSFPSSKFFEILCFFAFKRETGKTEKDIFPRGKGYFSYFLLLFPSFLPFSFPKFSLLILPCL